MEFAGESNFGQAGYCNHDGTVYMIGTKTGRAGEQSFTFIPQLDKWVLLYGSYIHPLSTKGTTLYFLMSMWLPYNTYLMSVELKDT